MGLEGEGSGGEGGERGEREGKGGKGEGNGDWVPRVQPLITERLLMRRKE